MCPSLAGARFRAVHAAGGAEGVRAVLAAIQIVARVDPVRAALRFGRTTSRQACPQGARVISGGFGLAPENRGPAAPRLELSYPDPNGWNVRAINGAAAGGAPADARAYAVCLGSKEGADIRNFQNIYYVGKDVLVKADNGEAKEAIGCGDEGAYVLAGGSRTVKGRSANVEMQESFPDSPGSWTVAVTNRGDKRAGDATVKLYAVCIKK